MRLYNSIRGGKTCGTVPYGTEMAVARQLLGPFSEFLSVSDFL